MSVTRIGGNRPTKDRNSRSSLRIHPRPSRWKNTSLR